MLKDVGGIVSLYIIETGDWYYWADLVTIMVLTLWGLFCESFILHVGAAIFGAISIDIASLATLSESLPEEAKNQWIAVAIVILIVTAVNAAKASTDDASLRRGARRPKGI